MFDQLEQESGHPVGLPLSRAHCDRVGLLLSQMGALVDLLQRLPGLDGALGICSRGSPGSIGDYGALPV